MSPLLQTPAQWPVASIQTVMHVDCQRQDLSALSVLSPQWKLFIVREDAFGALRHLADSMRHIFWLYPDYSSVHFSLSLLYFIILKNPSPVSYGPKKHIYSAFWAIIFFFLNLRCKLSFPMALTKNLKTKSWRIT